MRSNVQPGSSATCTRSRPRLVAAYAPRVPDPPVGRAPIRGAGSRARPAPPRPHRLGDGGARRARRRSGHRLSPSTARDTAPTGPIWGGEVLMAGYDEFERPPTSYVPLPGGDATIRKPYRAALAHLWAAGIDWAPDLPPVVAAPASERTVSGANSSVTSSASHLEHGPPVRRGELAAGTATHRLLRGPGRHRTGGGRRCSTRVGAVTIGSRSGGQIDPGPVLRDMVARP